MSTITLPCKNCGKEFQKDKNEYQRRLAKLPNCKHFFCTRSCVASYFNRTSPSGSKNPNGPPKQYCFKKGNTNGQKYNPQFTWYVQRIAKDGRFGLMTQKQRNFFDKYLKRLWKQQEGCCVFTGVKLHLREKGGKCTVQNPFFVASLDRVDNDRPYEKGNLQWVSLATNLARQQHSCEAFRDYLKEAVASMRV